MGKKGKTFQRQDIFRLYDENHGVVVVVDATRDDVVVPDALKVETRLEIEITRGSARRVKFNEGTVECTLFSADEDLEYTIPYGAIREVSPRTKEDFWDLKRAEIKRKHTAKKVAESVMWVLGCAGIGSLIYGFYYDVQYYGYSFYDGVVFLWRTPATFVLGKVCAVLVTMFETFFVIAIAPVAVLSSALSLSPAGTEIATVVVLAMWIWAFQATENSSQQGTTLSDLNLELLGLRPIFERRAFNIKSDYCFYVGPFDERATSIYQSHIREAIERVGLTIHRSDEIFGTSPVMDDIWISLNEAGIVLAEISGRNPNVMYEIGMAHTIGKKVIIITQDSSDIPFDLQRHRYIVYSDTPAGLEELEKKIVLSISQELGL